MIRGWTLLHSLQEKDYLKHPLLVGVVVLGLLEGNSVGPIVVNKSSFQMSPPTTAPPLFHPFT